IPSVFFFDSPVCQACAVVNRCRDESRLKLASLQARSVAIERMLREHEAHAAKTEIRASFMQGLDAAQRALVQRMPQQASRYYQTLLKRGIDKQVPHALACRENPFTEYGNRGAYLAFEL